jgi:integrase
MASIRFRKDRPDNPYQARVVGGDGRPQSKSFKNRTDAQRWARSVEVDVQRGEFLESRAGDRTFGKYADGWMVGRMSTKAPGTWKRDQSYLDSMILPVFKEVRVRSITTTDISEWVSGLQSPKLKRECASGTKATALQIVGAVLERARLDNAIRANPARDVPYKPSQKPEREGRALSDEELSTLLGAARIVGQDLAIVVMARLGLRIGEALGLRRSDLREASAQLTVTRSRDRSGDVRPLKGRRAGDFRTVPVPQDVMEAFARHEVETPRYSGDLFLTGRGTPLLYPNWRRSFWLPTLKAAGIENVVPHDLRRTCVTRLFIKDRWSPAEVQAFVGHSDARMTLEVYTSVNSRDLPMPSTLEAPNTGLEPS